MEKTTAQQVLDWMRSTDLIEVSYRHKDAGLTLRSDAAAPVPAAFPACSLVPLLSPEVGVFRWAALGSAGRLEKGQAVAAGQPVGLIQVGKRDHPLKAPAAGKIVTVTVDDGSPVEYGQPLLFVRPE